MNHPADSKLTLVDPSMSAAAGGGNTILFFDIDDIKNTVLRLRGDPRPHYFVHTVNNTKTTVHRGDLLLATIERRTFRPDQITFPGVSPMNLSGWLKAPMLSPFPISFEEVVNGSNGEKPLSDSFRFVLHAPNHSETVAWFSKSRKRVENGRRIIYEAFIAIKLEYDHMRDVIVVSCLLAEHKSRMMGKNAALAEGTATVGMMAYAGLQ